jgi:hypothetical protein
LNAHCGHGYFIGGFKRRRRIVKLESVFDERFREFGQIVKGYDFTSLLAVLRGETLLPDDGVLYVPSEDALEETDSFRELQTRYFGNMPLQLGYCNGHNSKLNGLEYHRDSEVNVSADDIILLLGRQTDIDVAFTYDTSKVRAFLLPAGTGVELYATTLHYAPCSVGKGGFRVAVALPKGTNVGRPKIEVKCPEDKLLTATNKWLLVHPEAAEEGLHVGLVGENIDVTPLLR